MPTGKDESVIESAVKSMMDQLSMTAKSRSAIERIGGKCVELSGFQQANGISDEIAEAAIKEWVLTHNRNFDWSLDEVKIICLRNKTDGIPTKYQPEAK